MCDVNYLHMSPLRFCLCNNCQTGSTVCKRCRHDLSVRNQPRIIKLIQQLMCSKCVHFFNSARSSFVPCASCRPVIEGQVWDDNDIIIEIKCLLGITETNLLHRLQLSLILKSDEVNCYKISRRQYMYALYGVSKVEYDYMSCRVEECSSDKYIYNRGVIEELKEKL